MCTFNIHMNHFICAPNNLLKACIWRPRWVVHKGHTIRYPGGYKVGVVIFFSFPATANFFSSLAGAIFFSSHLLEQIFVSSHLLQHFFFFFFLAGAILFFLFVFCFVCLFFDVLFCAFLFSFFDGLFLKPSSL